MNYIWVGMLISGIFFSLASGNISAFTDGLMSSCTEAVQFMINLTGIICVWSGLMNIAEKTHLITKVAHLSRPLMHFLFPEEKNPEIISTMLMSFISNIFGAGNSATVFSLKAMQLMDKENNSSTTANNTMCMFMAVSMSMIQIVPISVIKIRADLGSQNTGIIIIPALLAGIVSMMVSILICKIQEKKDKQL